MANVSLPKIKEVTVTSFDGKEQSSKVLTVIKMPLGRYAQFFEELEKIPETVKALTKMFLGEGADKESFDKASQERENDAGAIAEEKTGNQSSGEAGSSQSEASRSDDVTNDQMIEAIFALPGILTKHWNDLVSLLSIASGIEKDEIVAIDLDEATQVVVAVIEVNNFFGIGDRFNQVMKRKQTRQMTVPTQRKSKKR